VYPGVYTLVIYPGVVWAPWYHLGYGRVHLSHPGYTSPLSPMGGGPACAALSLSHPWEEGLYAQSCLSLTPWEEGLSAQSSLSLHPWEEGLSAQSVPLTHGRRACLRRVYPTHHGREACMRRGVHTMGGVCMRRGVHLKSGSLPGYTSLSGSLPGYTSLSGSLPEVYTLRAVASLRYTPLGR